MVDTTKIKNNECEIDWLKDFERFTFTHLKEKIKNENKDIESISFDGINNDLSIKDYLISKLHTVRCDEHYIIPATVIFVNNKCDEIKIRITTTRIIWSLFEKHNIRELFTRLLGIENKKHDEITIEFELGRTEYNTPYEGNAIDISFSQTGKILRASSKTDLNKLSYIFYHLDIPVTQILNRYEERAYKGEKYNSIDWIKSIRIHPMAIFKLFPKYEHRKPIPLTPIQGLCIKYLRHAWDAHQESQLYSEDLLNEKVNIIKELYYAKGLQKAKEILSDKDNQIILNTNRMPLACLILKSIGVLLTLPLSAPILLYNGSKRGSYNFFKPHSQIFAEQANAELSRPLV